MPQDPVPAEVRALEEIADTYHQGNPLMVLPFAVAGWYVLAHAEELVLAQRAAVIRKEINPNECDWGAFYDFIISNSKWPLYWAYICCPAGGKIPKRIDDETYTATKDLWDLGDAYINFETVFTYASLGRLTLAADEQRIRVSDDLRGDTRYEAYDRMTAVAEVAESPQREQEFAQLVQNTVRVKKNTFTYQLDPKIIAQGFEYWGEAIDARFRIPPELALLYYTIGDFQIVAKTLWLIANIHDIARVTAAMNGCEEIGWANALCAFNRNELKRRLVRYTGLSDEIVEAVTATMTYGGRGITYPDVALQPLVPLNEDLVAFSPTLIIQSALERNHMALLNRIEEEKPYYVAISDAREDLTRDSLLSTTGNLGLRTWYGNVPGWEEDGEVDLVLIDDKEKHISLIELKSFINPAETREVNHRAEEIEKGIEQLKQRKERHAADPQLLGAVTDSDDTYTTSFIVISENSIGPSYVQDDEFAVVNSAHFARELNRSRSLSAVSQWLDEKRHLPIGSTHFENVDIPAQIGSVSLDWYGINVLEDLPSL